MVVQDPFVVAGVMPPEPETLERETVYSLLADRVREYLLCHLSTVGRTTIPDAAERIAAWCRETAADITDDRRGIAVQLVHKHLPKLARYDVVDYEHGSEEIALGSNFEDLEPYVESLEPPRGAHSG